MKTRVIGFEDHHHKFQIIRPSMKLFAAMEPAKIISKFAIRSPIGPHGPMGPHGPKEPMGPMGPLGPMDPMGPLDQWVPWGRWAPWIPKGPWNNNDGRNSNLQQLYGPMEHLENIYNRRKCTYLQKVRSTCIPHCDFHVEFKTPKSNTP